MYIIPDYSFKILDGIVDIVFNDPVATHIIWDTYEHVRNRIIRLDQPIHTNNHALIKSILNNYFSDLICRGELFKYGRGSWESPRPFRIYRAVDDYLRGRDSLVTSGGFLPYSIMTCGYTNRYLYLHVGKSFPLELEAHLLTEMNKKYNTYSDSADMRQELLAIFAQEQDNIEMNNGDCIWTPETGSDLDFEWE